LCRPGGQLARPPLAWVIGSYVVRTPGIAWRGAALPRTALSIVKRREERRARSLSLRIRVFTPYSHGWLGEL
jgi:hypothetical protein